MVYGLTYLKGELKRRMLRAEKLFVQQVIEPLKYALIHEAIPPFAELMESVQRCHEWVERAGKIRRTEVSNAATEVESKPGRSSDRSSY